MSEIDAVGDVVTGGLLARAVEPGAGEVGADGHTHERNCLNCGCKLAGDFCHCCGQRAHVHRTLRGFLQDFLQGLFNFEGKIWRTLPMLAWRPGEMTRRYIAGERARFISPVALYLFTVFAMFAVLNLTGTLGPDLGAVGPTMEKAVAQESAELARLQAERERNVARGTNDGNLDRRIAAKKRDLAEIEKLRSGEFLEVNEMGADDAPAWVRQAVRRAQENPQLVVTNIQDAASKFSWLLIPISVPFLWLLFPLRRRQLYDHTVFVTYSLSFMMILVIIGGLLVAAGSPGLASILFFVPPFHMYRHLKGAYQLGRLSALMRTMALVTFAFVAAALFLAAAVAIGTM